ncbi:MAG TPA: HAD family hydrolase [Candidatus Limnocylindria bacterium]|nr:HAD family hydrolase [Candidatus Limnocylindria bacterium]
MSRNLVFLLDVDNTLLDNDRVKQDIRGAIAGLVAADRALRFWSLYEEVRGEEGVVDFPETLRRFRRAFPDEPRSADVDRAVLSVPFERYLFPRAIEVVSRLWTLGDVAILSDGDRVFQPAKIARAGLLLATRGNVLVYDHKEDHLLEVERRFPARHYAHVDDRAALLARTKNGLGSLATTIHVRQGHYASEPSSGPPPDITVERIADLLALDSRSFGG